MGESSALDTLLPFSKTAGASFAFSNATFLTPVISAALFIPSSGSELQLVLQLFVLLLEPVDNL